MQSHPLTNYSTSNSKEEALAEDEFVNPLPRAVLRNNKPILLDGEWHFALDSDDIGIREKWYMGHDYKNKAQWPGSIEHHIEQLKGIKDNDQKTWQGKVVAWYERDFPLPHLVSNGTPSMLQLTFGACGYETQVWLNGMHLRTIEGEDVHFGEYTSFSYELKEDNLRLFNRLTVRIADTWMLIYRVASRNPMCINAVVSGTRLIRAPYAVSGWSRWNVTDSEAVLVLFQRWKTTSFVLISPHVFMTRVYIR